MVDLGDDERGLTLTTEGRDLLDSHSLERDGEPSQMFYAGVSRSREIDHDSNLYATFRQEEARLRDEHADLEIRRVILEQDLKREYQEFLQEHNRGRSDSDGRPGPRRERDPRLGARTRSAVLRRPGSFPRLPHRVRGRWPRASPGRRALHAALPRRSRRQPRQDRLPHLRRRLSRWRRSLRAASARHGGVPVTHEYPPNRAFDSVSISRVSALRDFGLTQRQREFLVTVMVHSGCFLERQYCAFTGTVRGQNSREFVASLVARGFARAIEPGPVRRGRLYHVHHKPLYEAIGQADNRNRRLRTIGRMVERVMILDAVLGDRRCWWLSPECDKRAFFDLTQQTGLRPEDYPHIAFGVGPQKDDPLLPRQAAHRHREGRHESLRVPLPREPAHPGGLPPVPHSSRRPVPLPASLDGPICSCRGASGRPWRSTRRPLREELWTPLNPSVSKSLETYFRERQEQGGHLGDPSDRYIAQEFRKQGMPKIQALYRAWRRQGDRVLWQVVTRPALRDDRSHGCSAVEVRAAEPPVPPAHRHDGPGCVGQEGGQAKIASGWPPGFDALSGRSLTPGGSMSANRVQPFESQQLAASASIEAALCAAVTAGAGVAVAEPTMA